MTDKQAAASFDAKTKTAMQAAGRNFVPDALVALGKLQKWRGKFLVMPHRHILKLFKSGFFVRYEKQKS